MLSAEEKKLLVLFYSGSPGETAAVVGDALADIHEPDVRADAESVIRKLEDMSAAEFDCLAVESGCCYA